MVSASETSKARKPRIHDEMIAATEKSEASETYEVSEDFEASDAFEESAQKGRAMTRLLGVNAGASEASEKSVETGYVIRNQLAVNPSWKAQ